MAVAFDANATADATANGVTSITTSNLTVGAGSNRALVTQIIWSGTVTSPSITWDNGASNQAMAAIPSAVATQTCRVELWGLVNPVSGAKSMRAAWTTARDVYINGVSWTGVDQTGGATSFPNGTSATSAINSALSSVIVTSAVGNAVMAAHGTATTGFTAVNNTQTFLDGAATNVSGAGNRAAGAALVTMTATLSPTGTWAAVGTDIAAAAAAGSPFVVQESTTLPRAFAGPFARPFHVDGLNLNLLGQDQFFGAPGQGPDYDWPNPTRLLRRSVDLGTWLQNLSQSTLAPLAVAPFFGLQAPNPVRALRLPLSATQGHTVLAFTPVGAGSWSLPPRAATYPVALRTHIDQGHVRFIGTDTFFGAPGQVPAHEWTNPRLVARQTLTIAQDAALLLPVPPPPTGLFFRRSLTPRVGSRG